MDKRIINGNKSINENASQTQGSTNQNKQFSRRPPHSAPKGTTPKGNTKK